MGNWYDGWQQGVQGAMGGASMGAATGNPYIAAGAGILGGLAGWASGDPNQARNEQVAKYQQQLQQLAAGYGSRGAPQAGPAAQAGNSSLLQNRAGLISQLEAMARGEGPSAASLQMRQAMDQAAAAQSSAAAGAGGRGVNAGAALRNASNNTAAVQAQGARDTAVLRSREQMGAVGELGNVIGQGINSDNNQSQFNAGQTNNMSQANLNAQLQAMGINTQAQLQALMGSIGLIPPMAPGSNQGLGTSIFGGGAAAAPGLMQMFGNRQGSGPGSTQPYTPNGLDDSQGYTANLNPVGGGLPSGNGLGSGSQMPWG